MLIPLLIRSCLGRTITINALALLRSTSSLVLAPLAAGVAFAHLAPRRAERLAPYSPSVGIFATLLLVVGGAANSAALLSASSVGWRAHAASVALPLLSALGAFAITSLAQLSDRTRRTVVIESLVKSPTLAYALALRHFGPCAATAPAASMVWLAAIGALAATAWGQWEVVE